MATQSTVLAGEALRDHIIATADWMLVQSLSAQGAQEERRDGAGIALARIAEVHAILDRSNADAISARDSASAAVAQCLKDQSYLRGLIAKLRAEKEAGTPPSAGTTTILS